jgi:hypothetical protein
MKRLLLLKSLFLLCALVVGTSAWADPTVLFHETFGSNSNSARAWDASYSVKSGVPDVYSGASYTVSEAKQSKNTMGRTEGSALVSSSATAGVFIVGPLNVSSYETLAVTNYFGMTSGSWNSNSYMKMYYSTNGSTYTEVSRTDTNTPSGAVGSNSNYVQASYSLPAAAQSSTLYLKFEFYCYHLNKKNTEIGQAYFDEVELSGVETSGPITYSVTYNGNGNTSGDVPTDNTAYSSGATVTVLGNGSLAKAHCSFSGWNTQPDGNGTNYSAGATFSITANTTLYAKWTDNRTSAGLAWSAASASVKYGAGDNVFPTLTNTHGVDVTYTSTDHSAATIDENGIITLKNITKSTTISAIFAGNDDYLPQTETYTLNVNYGIEDGIFDFVEAASAGEDYGSGISTTTDGNHYETANATWEAGNVTMVTSSKYRWWRNSKDLRFYSNTPKSSFTLSVPSGKVIVKVVLAGGNAFSVSSGTLTSGTWIGAANSVTFEYNAASGSINVSKITVTYTDAKQTFNPAKEYTTLTSAYNLDFTGLSLKAYIATEVSGDKVQMTQVNKVPAGTGLVLKATTPGSAVNVPVFDGTSPDDVSGNKMVGSATETTAVAANGGYILKDGVFQPATAGTLAAGKAYLNIPVDAGARALEMNFDDNETTGLSEVTNTNLSNNTNEVFDLQGRKVAQPTKGLYIVNGKKVIIK